MTTVPTTTEDSGLIVATYRRMLRQKRWDERVTPPCKSLGDLMRHNRQVTIEDYGTNAGYRRWLTEPELIAAFMLSRDDIRNDVGALLT